MKIKNIIIIASFIAIGIGVWFFDIWIGWKVLVTMWMLGLIWVGYEMINAPLMDDDYNIIEEPKDESF